MKVKHNQITSTKSSKLKTVYQNLKVTILWSFFKWKTARLRNYNLPLIKTLLHMNLTISFTNSKEVPCLHPLPTYVCVITSGVIIFLVISSKISTKWPKDHIKSIKPSICKSTKIIWQDSKLRFKDTNNRQKMNLNNFWHTSKLSLFTLRADLTSYFKTNERWAIKNSKFQEMKRNSWNINWILFWV